MDNENIDLLPEDAPETAAPVSGLSGTYAAFFRENGGETPSQEQSASDEAEPAVPAEWEPSFNAYLYAAPKAEDTAKAARKARRKKNFKKVLSIVFGTVLFFAAFLTGSYMTSRMLKDSLQNGTFSFRDYRNSEESELPEPEYNTISDIAKDLRRSSCLVMPNVTKSSETYCSGVLVAERGDLLYIVTAYHSLEQCTSIALRFYGCDKNVPAMLRGYDRETDLCILYVYKSEIPKETLGNLRLATFADSTKVQVGDLAIVIGNPMEKNYEGSVSCGVISSPSRQMTVLSADETSGTTYYLIQTDAAINPGDSGCALVDGRGQLIGICNAYVDTVEGEGINFAVPSEKVVPVVEALIEDGRIARPFLGIVGTDVSGTNVAGIVPDGALVYNVTAGGPADLAGIISNDVIVEFDGVRVLNFDAVKAELAKHKVGDTVPVKVYRFIGLEEPEFVILSFTILDKTDFNN